MATRRRRPIDPVTAYIANQLRAAKDARGLTYDALAERSGMPRATVAAVLSGGQAITVEALHSLSAPLGVDPARLMAEAMRAR